MTELYAAIISAAIAVVGAVMTYLTTYLKTKAIKQRIAEIEEFFETDEGEYYIYCPKCNTRILLNQVKILYSKQKDK